MDAKESNNDVLKRVHIMEEEMLGVSRHIKVDKSLGFNLMYPMILWKAREEIVGHW